MKGKGPPRNRFGSGGGGFSSPVRITYKRKKETRPGKPLKPAEVRKLVQEAGEAAVEKVKYNLFFLETNRKPKGPTTYVIGFGGKKIERKFLVDSLNNLLEGNLPEVKKEAAEVTRYTTEDVLELGGSPSLGSKGTAKVHVFKGDKGLRIVSLEGIAVPSWKRNQENVNRNKSVILNLLAKTVNTTYRGNAVLRITLNSSDLNLIRILRKNFPLREVSHQIGKGTHVFEVDFRKKNL